MKNVLDQSETSVQTRAAISQLESCLSNASEVFRDLSENYQDLQVRDSQTIRDMAKNSEGLIPDRLSSPKSMILCNVVSAARKSRKAPPYFVRINLLEQIIPNSPPGRSKR